MRLAAAGGGLLGPWGVWLYEAGRIEFFESASLGDLWIVVLLAVTGGAICAWAIVRRTYWLGAAGLLVNLGVALLYGFLGVFFGLGGSR